MAASQKQVHKMADYVAKFYDAEVRPPRGGWSVVIHGREFSGFSENDVKTAIKSWQINNGTFVSDHDIIEKIWAIWISREPDRQVRDFPKIGTSIVNLARAAGRVITAAVEGKPIVSPQSEVARKRSICDSCTLLDVSKGVEDARCSYCSCSLAYKLSLETERCPVGKF